MKNIMMQIMLKKVFALFSQTKLIWLALLMFGTTAHAGVTVRYQHTDSLGSVIMETNASGQMIGSRHQYQPFGQGLNGQKTGLGYTGHLEDTDLGLTYMQQRYYDPVIGRFYSNDPVDMLGHMQRDNPTMGFNRYAYANNNPYKYTDPDGEFAFLIPIVGGIVGAVTAYNQARDMGFSEDEAMIAGATGALVGAVSGGITGTTAGLGVKAAANIAFNQSTTKSVAQLAASGVSGAVAGAGTQLLADASGDVAKGEPINIDGGKVVVKDTEGLATGVLSALPAAVAGKSIVTDVVGAGIAASLESEKVKN